MERKTLAIGIIVIVAIAAGATGAVIYFMTAPEKAARTLSIGQMYLPFTIDPQDAWDSASNNVIDQVVEGLLAYDLADPALQKVGRLATGLGTWDSSRTNYTLNLRTGVTFHDGTDFDADDVIFTFDRAAWLYNFTGLNTGYVPDVYELYAWPDHTPIVKDVHKTGTHQVIIELNKPYGPFEDLLCYTASSMLTDSYYDITGGIVELDGDIVGTGPFMYDSYEEDVEVICTAYDDYYRGKAQLETLVFVGIINAQARTAALFAGDIQYLYTPMDEMWDAIDATAGLTLYAPSDRFTSTVQYLSMNCVWLNSTWREVISYAFNYDYLVNTIRYGHCARLKSPIGAGIKYSNSSITLPTTNLTHARQVLQSMGYGVGYNVSADAEWVAATASSPFKTLNYSYNIGNDVREKVFIMIISNLAKVGIRVTDAGSTWSHVLQKCYELGGYTRMDMQLLFIGWGADYNDPCNFINPLFTNRSVAGNNMIYNGYLSAKEAGRNEFAVWDNVQLLMEAALGMEDGPVRQAYYDRIQYLLIQDMPWCLGYSGHGPPWAHVDNLAGIPYNAMGNYDLYPVHFT